MPIIKEVKEGKKKRGKMSKDKTMVDKVLGDISKSSASKQIFLGASSGWMVGFLGAKIGKIIAIATGGGIILLQIANDQGYININWNKVNRKIEKLTDKVEEKITGEEPSWMNKVEKFVERKLDKTEENLREQKTKVKHWYSSFVGEECKLKEMHIFLLSFVAGVSIGVATG